MSLGFELIHTVLHMLKYIMRVHFYKPYSYTSLVGHRPS